MTSFHNNNNNNNNNNIFNNKIRIVLYNDYCHTV